MIAAITRRSRSGSIGVTDATIICKQFRNDFQKEYQIVEITESIINSGMAMSEAYGLRGYDAIQLAASCAINSLCISNGLSACMPIQATNRRGESPLTLIVRSGV
jgi:hypothetical protein